MKISAFHKSKGDVVVLKAEYKGLEAFDKVYISKVFTDTEVPQTVLSMPNVEIGGTGFYFDKASPLHSEIEHAMPDYHLYDDYVEYQTLLKNKPKSEFKAYTDYSIGFTTRGCFRKCAFCVNQKYSRVEFNAHPSEFVDTARKKICLLDDNFLGYPEWEKILLELNSYNKPIVFKQGLDARLLTEKKSELLFSLKYDGEFIFAFDDVSDYEIIERKLKMIRRYTDRNNIKFYVLVGFKGTGIDDIRGMFERIQLLMKYRCLPYIMKYQSPAEKPYEKSEFRGIYIAVARWCNQPNFFKTLSFREFCEKEQARTKTKVCASMRALQYMENTQPELVNEFFDVKWREGV